MQANWSLILNVFLLIGVVIAIGRLMKARHRSLIPQKKEPSLGQEPKFADDIIAVRKVNYAIQSEPNHLDNIVVKTRDIKESEPAVRNQTQTQDNLSNKSVMMFLLAKENRQLAGYELLQTVLAAGLRFGEGNLFHRHQHANGQGPVLCSLAAATASGVFDLQNIGAFRVRGLCLYMHASGNPTIDEERFSIMYETAKQLSDGLDTYLLDENRKPLIAASLQHYRAQLKLEQMDSSLA